MFHNRELCCSNKTQHATELFLFPHLEEVKTELFLKKSSPVTLCCYHFTYAAATSEPYSYRSGGSVAAGRFSFLVLVALRLVFCPASKRLHQ